MPGYPCCCAGGPFDIYEEPSGRFLVPKRNYLILTPSRWPAGTLYPFSTYSSADEGFTVKIHDTGDDDECNWRYTLADNTDRVFALRIGQNAQHHDVQLGDPTGYVLTWAPHPDAKYNGRLWPIASPSSTVYAAAQIQIFGFNDHVLEIIAESDAHQHLVVQILDLGFGEAYVVYTFHIDLFAKTCDGYTVDLGDGRTSYRFPVYVSTPFVPGSLRVYMTDGPSSLDYTGDAGDAAPKVRLYHANLYPDHGELNGSRDLAILDVPTGVRKVHYLPFYLESHFSDQWWKFVEFGSEEAFTSVPDVFVDFWWTIGYGIVDEILVSPGEPGPAPHPDMLVNPGVRPFSAFGWSVGNGAAGYFHLPASGDGQGQIKSTVGFPTIGVVYEWNATEWHSTIGRTGSVKYQASPEDPEEWLPEPYCIPPHGYPNIFGIDWARQVVSQPEDEVPPGDGDNPPESVVEHVAKITFGPYELLNVCRHYGDYTTEDPCTTTHEEEPPSGSNAALAKYLSPGRETFFSRSNSVVHEWHYGSLGEWVLEANPTVWVGAIELTANEDHSAGICYSMAASLGDLSAYDHTWYNDVAVVIDGVEVITKQVFRDSELLAGGYEPDEFGVYHYQQRFRGIYALPGGRTVFFERRWQTEPTEESPGVTDPVHAWDLVCYQGTTELFRIPGGTPPEVVGQPNVFPRCFSGGHEWFYVEEFWLCDDRLSADWHTNWVISTDGSVRFPQSSQTDDVNDTGLSTHSASDGSRSLQSVDCVRRPSKLRVGLRKNTWDNAECS